MAILKTKHFILNNGERYKVLSDPGTGIPLFYPTLYITSQIRGSGQSVSTIQSFITSITVLLGWSNFYSIDLENRFKKKEFLSLREIESIRDFCKKPLRRDQSKKSKIIVLKRNKEGVRMAASRSAPGVLSLTQYHRMTYIADYLKWLAEIITIKNFEESDRAHISEMYNRLKAHRPQKKNRTNTDRDEKGLDPEIIEKLLTYLKPGHKKNPFQDSGVQIRNALIIGLLKVFGIRRGELLNLRTEDIDFHANRVAIIRRPDSLGDGRTYQPLVKTLERSLIMNEALSEKINAYIIDVRSKIPQARRHPYLFVTHKTGPYYGSPLSNSGFGKIMRTIQKLSESFSGVHAHAFRHTWNYFLSSQIDSSTQKMSPAEEEQIRSYLMGWKIGSKTASTYNKRFIKEKANETLLEYQNNLTKEIKQSDEIK